MGTGAITSYSDYYISELVHIDHMSSSMTESQVVYFHDDFTANQNTLVFGYAEGVSGDITTNRPEVELATVAYSGNAIGAYSYAIAYDGTDTATPIYITEFALE
jgi:hypothetical protein